MKYIFDLDNTLIFTNRANNIAYNQALLEFGYPEICNVERITKEVIRSFYSNIDEAQISEIIKAKRTRYNPANTELNHKLVQLVLDVGKEDCILWTSAEQNRVHQLLDYHKMNDMFSFILFSCKKNVKEDINTLCHIFNLSEEDLVFFDDDENVLLDINKVSGVVVKHFCDTTSYV